MSDNFGNGGMSPGGSLLSFLFGAVVGAGIALLMAPATGEETRRRLTDTARGVGQKLGDTVGTAKEEIKGRADDVRTAVNAGRDAYSRSRLGSEPAPTSNAM